MVVYNKDYKLGQAFSLQACLRALDDDLEGFLVFPVDCPWVSNQTIDDLFEVFRQGTSDQGVVGTFNTKEELPEWNGIFFSEQKAIRIKTPR